MAWWCKRDMSLDDLISSLQIPVLFRSCPKVILFHLGGNDLTKHSLKCIFKIIIEAVTYVHQAFPEVKIIWVDILPRVTWGEHACSLKAIEKKRKRVNQMGRKQSNGHITVDIDVLTLGFFRDDGIHLSDVGLEFYNDAIREGILSYIL